MAQKKSRAAKSQHDGSERALSSDQPLAIPFQAPFNSYPFFFVLAAGIAVRVIAFACMGYFNNDNHLPVIEYIAERWVPPDSAQFNQAYHPPLYYFLAAFFFRLGSLPAVHGLSLILSIATLFLIAYLFRPLPSINQNIQPWAHALSAF